MSKTLTSAFVVGLSLFAMLFGGGNLTFPLWVGIQSTSLWYSVGGFLISGVAVPFYGILIGLAFAGNYEKCLNVWGKTIGQIIVFALLLFWIPLGSGPRCNQLAYGAFAQLSGGSLPLWLYSAIYTLVVFLIAYRKRFVLDIVGMVLTPVLLATLCVFVYLASQNVEHITTGSPDVNWGEFQTALFSGYHTQDFIATIFFFPMIMSLIIARGKGAASKAAIVGSFLLAMGLMSAVYIGMIFVGNANSVMMQALTRDQLLAGLARFMFQEQYHMLMYVVITLSSITTSVALGIVFADYLRQTIFKEKIGYKRSLAITLGGTYVLSTLGFESVAVIISYAMSVLYPLLIVTTFTALIKYKVLQPATNLSLVSVAEKP